MSDHVGELCIHCGEPFAKGDQLSMYANGPIAHYACFMRQVIGSVGHQQKRCLCFVPESTEGDPPGMTVHQAAEAALEYFRLHRTGESNHVLEE